MTYIKYKGHLMIFKDFNKSLEQRSKLKRLKLRDGYVIDVSF
jgi:hypothetical protein